MSFHEGPKCLDDWAEVSFRKGAEGAEEVGAEVEGVEVQFPMTTRPFVLLIDERKLNLTNTDLLMSCQLLYLAFSTSV